MKKRDQPHPHHTQVWTVLACEDCKTTLRHYKAARIVRDARGILDHDFDEKRASQ